jgi:hypothetical protein
VLSRILQPSGLWTTGIKKCLAAPGTQLGSHVFKARSRVTEAPARRVTHVATVWFNSAMSAQLTTLGHGYSGDTIRQDGTMVLAMFSITR